MRMRPAPGFENMTVTPVIFAIGCTTSDPMFRLTDGAASDENAPLPAGMLDCGARGPGVGAPAAGGSGSVFAANGPSGSFVRASFSVGGWCPGTNYKSFCTGAAGACSVEVFEASELDRKSTRLN